MTKNGDKGRSVDLEGHAEPGPRMRFGMDLLATFAAVTGCVLLVWLNWIRIFPPDSPLPRTPISLEGAASKGSLAAPVVLIEYSDYQCPYCAKAEIQVLPTITKQYINTGKVQLAFRHHPLERLHPMSTRAAEVALCAGRQGKFWEMNTALFEDQKHMDEESFVARAQKLALDERSLSTCLAGAMIDRVRADATEAEALGLTGTPAFVVGRRQPDGRVRVSAVIRGVQPLSQFEKAISEALQTRSALGSVVAGSAAVLVVAFWFGIRRRRVIEDARKS